RDNETLTRDNETFTLSPFKRLVHLVRPRRGLAAVDHGVRPGVAQAHSSEKLSRSAGRNLACRRMARRVPGRKGSRWIGTIARRPSGPHLALGVEEVPDGLCGPAPVAREAQRRACAALRRKPPAGAGAQGREEDDERGPRSSLSGPGNP